MDEWDGSAEWGLIKLDDTLLYSHFLEEVPEGDDLQLLQDQEDAAADEKRLVFDQSFVEQQEVSLTDTHTHTHTHTRA